MNNTVTATNQHTLLLVSTYLFKFDCQTSNVCLCKSRSNLFLDI